MKYLDVINNCKIRIENEFKEFAFTLKSNALFSELNSYISSDSFVNEFQLVDCILSFYIPELNNTDLDGIDLSIGLFQIRETKNKITSYTSNIQYDTNGDLIFDNYLYVSSDICTTTGTFILKNNDHEIMVSDVNSFEKELTKAIDCIFISFKSNVELMSSKISDIRKRT